MTNPPTDGHSKHSPSKLALTATCPGYVSRPMTAEEEADDFSPSAVGTRVHAALEAGDPGTLLTRHEHLLYTAASNMVETLKELMAKESGTIEFEILPEHTFKGITLNPADPIQSGTADVLFRHGDISIIVDYKMGIVPVSDPQENPQFIYYGLLEMAERPECQRIILAVVQPSQHESLKIASFYRSSKAPKFVTDMEEVPMDEATARASLEAVIQRYERDKNNPYAYTSSPHVCTYCAKLAECKKITSMARNFALKSLKNKELAEAMLDSVGSAMDQPETLGALLSFQKIMEAQNKVHKDYAKTLFSCGVEVPGWKYASRGNTIKVDTDSFRSFIEQELTGDEILDSISKLPVAKLIDLFMDKRGLGSEGKTEKKEAKELLLKELEDLGIIKEVKSSIALIQAK